MSESGISQQITFMTKKALVFFPHNPYPSKTGAHKRCMSLLNALTELGYDVTLLGSDLFTDHSWEFRSIYDLQNKFAVKVQIYQGTQFDRYYIQQMSANNVGDSNFKQYITPGLKYYFRQLFKAVKPEIIVVNYSLWGELAIEKEFNSAIRIIDTHDLFTLNTKMSQAVSHYLSNTPIIPANINPQLLAEDFYARLQLDAEPDEYGIFDQYDYTIAMSSVEEKAIRKHTYQTKVRYIPMTFSPELLNNTYTDDPLLVIGNNLFNVQGFLYFVSRVLPKVQQQLPKFCLKVVGNGCKNLLPMQGIQLLGFVPHLKPLYSESKFAICPLIGGTGQQVKIVEAMAHGVAVIALRNVAYSSPIEHGVNGLIAENAEEFAEYVIQLYRDPQLCRQLGQAARKKITENFSTQVLVERLKQIADSVKSELSTASSSIVLEGKSSELNSSGNACAWESLEDSQEKKSVFKVSAIISTYNSEKFIRGCLQDLVEQTLYEKGELEIIVVDSASPQNEKSIVQEFQKKYPNIIYERTSERETLYAAWNRAIKMSRGCYITNANTDDRHRFDALEVMANYLDERPEICLVYADQLITTTANDTFAKTKANRHWNWPPYSYEQMRQGCCISSQPMWRKSLHEIYGYFRAELHCAGDYEFWLRLGSHGENMALIPVIFGLYYFNPQGLEHGAPGRAAQETDLVCDQYNIPRLYIPKMSGEERKFSDLQYQGIILTEEEKDQLALIQEKQEKIFPRIAIDGVFFQLNQTGIARVWRSVLEEWSKSSFAHHIIVLDRGKTAPRIPGVRYRNIEPYNYETTGLDSQRLQFVCEEVGADLFVSTYYTTPLSTPSIFMAYDMIPEVIGADLKDPMWKEKHYGIFQACRYVTISQSTADDLIKFFPNISPELVTVAHCGITNDLAPVNSNEIINFKTKYSIQKPYFLLVGSRLSLNSYKNATLFFKALNQFSHRDEVAVICIGGEPTLEPELAELVGKTPVHLLKLDDAELRVAYSGAIALVYPSLYEGFGLPIAEAMACGCPVITCRNSSIPEVAGEAAIYVGEYRVEEMVEALRKVQIPEVRQSLIERGFEQIKQFSWTKMAETIANVLMTTAEQLKDEKANQTPLIWQEFRKMQAQLQKLSSQPELQPAQPQSQKPVEELKRLKIQLVKKQQKLQDAEATLVAMQSSKFWKLRSAWFQLKPLLFPLGSLIIGLSLLVLSNLNYTYPPLFQLVSWFSQFQTNSSFIVGVNLISLALILGIVGYFDLMNAKILRLLRIALVSGGLMSIILHYIVI
jgi:glycosyltransferase involved in cell wall biosynthesis/cellulose synthase/poly-beta-1,6-N-acetylglucosamine synthase-like glycosyltransferase